MARILSQTLIRGHPSHLSAARSPLLPLSAACFVSLRARSHRAERDLEAAEPSEGEVEIEVIGVRRFEDAIHSIIIRRSAPDWLPFIPGASYWVPPRKQAHRVAELIEKLSNPWTEEETLSFMTNRGWPSSSHFLEGTSSRRVKRKPKKATAQSDDEE
ncbi:uncharacterized protein LOC103713092 [Phoenix dactylifera]|uniref:Uncharacterized protein LOC103713092 n=1 Tax=Phoenix dactylifera TaxID=42345 RepID=A0A8B7CFF1_PHODC|nr:uncharacterized protein LOC103713092 [Phoenix dactylifera]